MGQTIADANIRLKTECTVIAIKRDTENVTDIGPDTKIEPEDELIIVGTDPGIRDFERSFT